jgi:hypothetical protein
MKASKKEEKLAFGLEKEVIDMVGDQECQTVLYEQYWTSLMFKTIEKNIG